MFYHVKELQSIDNPMKYILQTDDLLKDQKK